MGLELELIARQRDGTEFAVMITLSPIDTGDVLVLVKAAGDVTKRQEALENAQRMTAIVANSDDAIIGKTRDGIITSWNPAAERIYGYTGDEMVGKSMDALIPQDRASEMKAILAKVRAGQAVDHLETIRTRKDGEAITVSISVSPIRDDDGAIIGASTITHEVTKEMEAFEAARAMIESSLDSLVAISPEGMITDVNQATAKVTGIPREELIGTSFSDYFTDPEKANAIYQLVFAKGMAVDYPLTMRHRDGTLAEVLYNASVYRNNGGKVLGVFAAARDVSQQNRAQREIA
jgi:PAS domain S-box-containing protein